jgi:hypothetical protein
MTCRLLRQEDRVPRSSYLGRLTVDCLCAALESLWLRRYGDLREAIRVNPTFASAASRLCHAPSCVLGRDALDAALAEEEEGRGVSVLDLVKQELRSVRPRSDWARDLPPEAFPEGCDEVVTPGSAVDPYCLKRLERGGLLPDPEVRRAPRIVTIYLFIRFFYSFPRAHGSVFRARV